MSWTKTSSKEYRAYIALRLMEIKTRGETLERLHQAIETEITASLITMQKSAASENDDFIESITEEECLAIEELLGLAFVAAQSFINAIRTELIIVAKISAHEFGASLSFALEPKAYDALKLPPMLGATYSAVQAVNAVANYWKHSEEWPVRDETSGGRIREVWDFGALRGNEKTTVEIVTALGLVPNSSGNLRKGAKALGVREFDDLSPIRSVLSGWSTELLKKARTEFGIKN